MSDKTEHTTERAVWKFELPFPGLDVFTINMPASATPLTVQVQHGEPHIWALVVPGEPIRPRRFRIAGTGHPISDAIKEHVGTFQIANGDLVFHIFEILDDASRTPAEVQP